MSARRPLAIATIALALSGCSGDDPGAPGGGGASSTGAGAAPTCPPDTTLRSMVVAAVEPGASCIDLGADVALDVCEDPTSSSHGFACFEEAGSGRRIWLHHPASTPRDREAWTSCGEQGLPPPCFTGGCPDGGSAPVGEVASTCTEEATRAEYRCGSSTSPYDAACCPRPACDAAGACPDGMACAEVGHSSARSCARTVDGGCGCGGTPDARVSEVCFPE